MEFLDNTGHIFSLKSYNEKPIGYEYEETPYIFWMDSNTSRLSINNYYSRPIYALYLLDKDYNIDELMKEDSPIQISIEIENSNVYKLIDSLKFNEYILSNDYNDLNDYIDLGNIDEHSDYLKTSLTNENLFVIKTNEKINNDEKLNAAEFNYLLIPIYHIACANEEGTWITNIMIHIYNEYSNKHEWCPISIGGEFIDEFEELVINERNIGVDLPKDILKAVYSESLYNDEFNEALFNEKLKEYLINKTIIKHECGNFNSAIASLKWFGYGDKLSIGKLLKTDNEYENQYLIDYFNVKNDIIEAFKVFTTGALISLKLMINRETDEQYPFDFSKNINTHFFGENKPKMLSLLDHYEKIKIGNHDMPIENDDEKYWYWKPYFDFSFTELGIKLACLKQFYKKYFLPLHLYIHNASLGYRVFANDIKYTITTGVSMNEPLVSLNTKPNDIEFKEDNIYYFTKQIHYIDENFNEFNIRNVDDDPREWFELNDTCVSIPIKFINNEINKGYFNCVALLINKNISDQPLLERHFSFYQNNFTYENFIIYPKKINLKRNDNYWWIGPEDAPINTHVKVTNESKIFEPYIINNQWYIGDTYICDQYLDENGKDYIPYPKYIIDDLSIETNYLQYWIDDNFILKLLVNNKWYEYNFKLKIHNPTIDFGTLRYRYYLNEHNYLLSRIVNESIGNETKIHSFIFYNKELKNKQYNIYADKDLSSVENINKYMYEFFNLNYEYDFVKTLDLTDVEKLWQYFESNYNVLSPFTQLNRLDHINKRVSFNAYMHNCELVNVNNINYDIDFYTILKYHLDHNLMYIDGTLLNREFYQFILFNYNGRDVEVLIHKDMMGLDIEIPMNYFNKDKVVVCSWKDTLYILEESSENSDSYYINTLDNNTSIFVSEGDDDSYALLLDSLSLKYDKATNSYYSYDPITGAIIDIYPIYDKLYHNTDYIYNKYDSEINFPNLDKYKNSLHLFDIYTQETVMNNILIFHNDIDMYINGLRFEHGQYNSKDTEESLKIYVSGKSNSQSINSRFPDIYGLHLIDNIKDIPNEVIDNNIQYGFYVKRNYQRYYEPIDESDRITKIYDLENIFEFDTNEFSYYVEKKDSKVGEIKYKTLDDFYNDNRLDENYNIDDIVIFKENDQYYFYDLETRDLNNLNNLYKNEVYYTIEFFKNNNNIPLPISLNSIYDVDYDYVLITLYYHKRHIVRNRFYLLGEYAELNEPNYNIKDNYTFIFISDNAIQMSNNNNSINDKYIINLIKYNTKYQYEETYGLDDNSHMISNQNPAYYWVDIDNNSIKTLPSYLNELERFMYDAQEESLEDILSKLDEYKSKYETNQNSTEYLDDSNEALYNYVNYLSKDFTGKKGKFVLSLQTNFESNIVNLMVEIFDKDNNRNVVGISNTDEVNEIEFTLNGDENSVVLYIQLNNLNINNAIDDQKWIIPKLYEKLLVDQKLEYKYDEAGDDNILLAKVLNKEYYYGNNRSENVYNLYNDFFDLQYNIYDSYIENNTINISLLNSVYDVKDKLKLKSYLDYDFYLMHDDQYWYGLYISKQTCNLAKKYSDFQIPVENKEMIFNSKDDQITYKLKYNKSSKEYLINRFEFISSNGNNHFKDDDIIACYINNNDRLAFNPYISSKWSISPMSLGMSTDSKFNSNAEMTILSMPKNDNKYQRGYYKVTVKYSLDRDIQHQFKNTSTLLIS